MKKALLKIILIAFLVSVIDPASLLARNLNQTSTSVELRPYKRKMSVRAVVKAWHSDSSNDVADQGQKLPRWAIAGPNSHYVFDGLCKILLSQNTGAIIYKQQYFSRLLFPKHFFS